MAAVVTSVVVDGSAGTVTINGSGFLVGCTITVRDPFGRPVTIIKIVLLTPTQIVLLAVLTVQGQYCVTVVNPIPPPLSLQAGSFLLTSGE